MYFFFYCIEVFGQGQMLMTVSPELGFKIKIFTKSPENIFASWAFSKIYFAE
jgi:hypothetical protein